MLITCAHFLAITSPLVISNFNKQILINNEYVCACKQCYGYIIFYLLIVNFCSYSRNGGVQYCHALVWWHLVPDQSYMFILSGLLALDQPCLCTRELGLLFFLRSF